MLRPIIAFASLVGLLLASCGTLFSPPDFSAIEASPNWDEVGEHFCDHYEFLVPSTKQLVLEERPDGWYIATYDYANQRIEVVEREQIWSAAKADWVALKGFRKGANTYRGFKLSGTTE